MITVDDCGYDVPWSRYGWTGAFVSLDGAAGTADFTLDDIERVVAFGKTHDDWDGRSAGIVLLKDGRYVSWESWWDCTGSGFCCDAYGGTADIMFALTEEAARGGISEQGRELLRDAA